jgi:hypothetical protein
VPRRSLTVEQVLTMLAETPPRIAMLTAGLAPAQLHSAPNDGEWSANDTLAHLRACADVWGSCIATMIARHATAGCRSRTDQKRTISNRNFDLVASLYHAAYRSLQY